MSSVKQGLPRVETAPQGVGRPSATGARTVAPRTPGIPAKFTVLIWAGRPGSLHMDTTQQWREIWEFFKENSTQKKHHRYNPGFTVYLLFGSQWMHSYYYWNKPIEWQAIVQIACSIIPKVCWDSLSPSKTQRSLGKRINICRNIHRILIKQCHTSALQQNVQSAWLRLPTKSVFQSNLFSSNESKNNPLEIRNCCWF